MEHSLINWVVLSPFLGALAQVLIPNLGYSRILVSRIFGISLSLVGSLVAIFLVASMKAQTPEIQVEQILPWVGAFKISYHLGINGLNALVLLLIALVFPVLLLSEWNQDRGVRGMYGLLLLLQSAFSGLVLSQDLFLLFFFWAVSSLPLCLLVAIWGDKEKEDAATQLLVTSSIGNALFFLALVLIYYSVEPHTFSFSELSGGKIGAILHLPFEVSLPASTLAFFLIAGGIALRIPVWPLHGWFSYVATQAPASAFVAISGVFIPVAAYVFAKIGYSLFPVELSASSNGIVVLASINILLGAFSMIAQKDLRRFSAFLCLTDVGLLLLGFCSLDAAGAVGSTYLGLAAGLALTGFGLFSGLIRAKAGQTEFMREDGRSAMGGAIHRAPALAVSTAIVLASTMGLPGLGGFVGHSLVMMGGYSVHPWSLVLILLGLFLMTFALFNVFRYVFLGKADESVSGLSDLSAREKSYLYPVIGALILLGIYPKPLLELVRPSVELLISHFK